MANMRTLVSYDDITLPYPLAAPLQSYPQPTVAQNNPAKRRKWNKKSKGRNRDNSQIHSGFHDHDHALSSTAMVTDNESVVEEEGRELTHDEIWDDSALVDAWNAATEEYEAYNGPDKGWKMEPIHKSPLWYNIPKPERMSNPGSNQANGAMLVPPSSSHGEENSHPFNFETFIPSHDPALGGTIPDSMPVSVPNGGSQFLSEPPGILVDQDEAFTRAVGAMYWSGYWTAMYHCQRHAQQKYAPVPVQQSEEELVDEDDTESEEGDNGGEDGFVAAQR